MNLTPIHELLCDFNNLFKFVVFVLSIDHFSNIYLHDRLLPLDL